MFNQKRKVFLIIAIACLLVTVVFLFSTDSSFFAGRMNAIVSRTQKILKLNNNFSAKKLVSRISLLPKADGEYELAVGGQAVASNNIGSEIVDITPLENCYKFSLNFYAGSNKLNLVPIQFFSENTNDPNAIFFNVFFALRVEYSKDLIDRDGQKLVHLTLRSVEEGRISNCQGLVDICVQKGYADGGRCNQLCENQATSSEASITGGNALVILPTQLDAIKRQILNQIRACYGRVTGFLPFHPFINQIILRLYLTLNSGPIVTSTHGITWPVYDSANGINNFMGKFSGMNANSCQDNAIAHELVHYLFVGFSMLDFYDEGIATFVSERIIPPDDGPVVCNDEGWFQTQSSANGIQRKCFSSLRNCYESNNMTGFMRVGESFAFPNGKTITVLDLNANAQDMRFGNVEFAIADNRGREIDRQRLNIGDLYAQNGLVFLVYQTWEGERVGMEYYETLKENAPAYCNGNARSMCEVRINGNEVRYMDPTNYLNGQWPYSYTSDMFYNTGKCLFGDIDATGHENLLELFRRMEAQKGSRFCMGTELKDVIGGEQYTRLQNKFHLGENLFCTTSSFSFSNTDMWNPANN